MNVARLCASSARSKHTSLMLISVDLSAIFVKMEAERDRTFLKGKLCLGQGEIYHDKLIQLVQQKNQKRIKMENQLLYFIFWHLSLAYNFHTPEFLAINMNERKPNTWTWTYKYTTEIAQGISNSSM